MGPVNGIQVLTWAGEKLIHPQKLQANPVFEAPCLLCHGTNERVPSMSLELSHLSKQDDSCYPLGGNEDEVSSCSQSALPEAEHQALLLKQFIDTSWRPRTHLLKNGHTPEPRRCSAVLWKSEGSFPSIYRVGSPCGRCPQLWTWTPPGLIPAQTPPATHWRSEHTETPRGTLPSI